jgi:hypothetical protein
MPTYKSINEIITDITQSSLPAMVIDTCVVFDIVRCIWRGNTYIIKIANQLINAQQNGQLLLYAHSVLNKEIVRNQAEIEGEARKKADSIDDALAQYHQASGYLNATYPYSLTYNHQSIIPYLITLRDQLLNACVHIRQDDGIRSLAFDRSSNGRRPATHGGGTNDCLMFEEFRYIAKSIPNANPLILFTTNTKDFADKTYGSTRIHAEISNDLDGTEAQVCLNWNWAFNEALGQGT